MKRIYLTIAATATILAGCTNTDILRGTDSEDIQKLITFDTYNLKGTKAPVFDETDLTKVNGGFGVFAYKHKNPITVSDGKIDLSAIYNINTNPVFDNTLTWYNTDYIAATSEFFTKYQYEFPRYWDKQMVYTFFAYAPHASKAEGSTKGVSIDPATGFITRNDIHKIQAASSATEKSITNGDVTVKRAQYDIADNAIKDYLLAPCVPAQSWHHTNQTIGKDDPDYWKNSEITVGFIFHHMLSKLNVNINAQNEEYEEDAQSEKKGHEYKGIKSIYVTKLQITNMPALTDLDDNYITCAQNKVNFTNIYNTASETPLTFTPSNYDNENLEIVKANAGATTTYSINGEEATANPLYILDGGIDLDSKPAGGKDVQGYIDQKFQYYVAPNKPTVTTGNHHDLNIDYYIEYLDGKSELFSRTIQLDSDTFNFDEMLASYIYNITITISLDQIYITVDDVEWNSGPNQPADVVIDGEQI